MSASSGKVAVVTGGTRGIGRAVAKALLEAGWSVAVGSRSPDAVEAVRAALEAEVPGRVFCRTLDVREPDDARSFIDAAAAHFGRLDLLVNNAGVGLFRPVQELSLDDWDLQVRTNLDGVFYCSRAAIPHLTRNDDGGWIINIGSIASRNPVAGGAGYNASKFGLLGLTEAMMLDLRHEGIRVSLVMPGTVGTEFFGAPPGPEDDWKLRPEDVARGVLDLLDYPPRALPSRIELRPTTPPKR